MDIVVRKTEYFISAIDVQSVWVSTCAVAMLQAGYGWNSNGTNELKIVEKYNISGTGRELLI